MSAPKLIRLILLIACSLAMLPLLHAAYLNNMPITLTQPDGNQLECFASGDEYHNWLHDSDNYTIIRSSATGYYCYAQKSGEIVTASTVIAGRELPQSRGFTPGINISKAAYKELRRTKFYAPPSRNAPTTGTINNIVIYIRFSGETEFGQNISTYTDWFNTGTSSLKSYYQEASYNQLTVNTTFYPSPANNLVVSWQDSHARSYFQPYDATTNPGGYNGDDQRRDREFALLVNATNGVASQIPINLVVDSNNDGKVDNVVFIVRGGTDAWSSLLWPHRWSLYDRIVRINGKQVYDFNFQLQTHLASSGVGVICHEFFHTLGAPDLYHYTSNGISPAGSWDIMQSDQNPPQHMGAYMKWKYGHWISSITTISTDRQYSLLPITSSAGNCYRINSTNANQYYIVEFRKKTGTFESSIPGSGLLVYRIDTSVGDGNADGPPDEVYIYRPGGTTTADGAVNSANFSTETGRTRINTSTNPAPFLQDGSAGNLSLYNIGSSAGSTISFNKGIPPIVTIDFATNPYVQSFEDVSFPPDGWNNQAVVGTKVWERVTTGGSPTCSPQSGAGMARYNSYSATLDNSAYLSSPRIDCSNILNYSYSFSLQMYRDTGYNTKADRVEVYLNTAQNLNGSPTLLGIVNRYTGMAPLVNSQGWYQYSYNLPLPSAGYYYIVLKAISAYGNNMFVDSFSFTRTLLPPSAAINPVPANSATGISFAQVLSWQSGGGIVSGYKLYLGTNNPPTNLVNGSNLGLVTSYTRSGGWNYATQYYWKIVPINAGGDAAGCSIWTFGTMADPRIAVLPHQEKFDIPLAPSLPIGWNSVVSSTSTSAYVQSSTTYPFSNPNSVRLYNSTDTTADLRLITPEILLPLNSLKLKLSARGSSTGYQLLVGTVGNADGSGVFSQIASLDLTNVHTEYVVSFAGYAGTNRYLALKHGLGGTSRSIYIDDFRLEALLNNDLAVSALSGLGLGAVGESISYQISITNNGLLTQNSYTIKLMAQDRRSELSSLQVNTPLAPDATAVHSISWLPLSADSYSVYAAILLPGDGNPANDTSPAQTATVLPEGTYLPLVGDPDISTTANLLPINFYWKNSLSETIYLASELKMAIGNISGMAFKGNFVQELSNKPVKIWIKNTTESDLSTAWSSFVGYTLVFDGTLNFPLGTGLINIPFFAPYAYGGANLALRVSRPMDTEYYNTNNHFFYSDTPDFPNRSRYIQSDSAVYDPAAPSAVGTVCNFIPFTFFAVDNAALAIPQISIVEQGQNFQLSWNAVLGAKSYLVYASENPLIWPENPIAQVTGTIYNCPISGKQFFKIVASTAQQ